MRVFIERKRQSEQLIGEEILLAVCAMRRSAADRAAEAEQTSCKAVNRTPRRAPSIGGQNFSLTSS